MSDEIGPRLEESLGILEVEKVRSDFEPLRVGGLDDGGEKLGGHLRARAEVVVDANFDEVDAHGCVRLHGGLDLWNSLACHDRARNRNSGAIEARIFGIPETDRVFAVAS